MKNMKLNKNKTVKVKILSDFFGKIHYPTYAKKGDAGADIKADEEVVIKPGGTALVRTGVFLEVPRNHVGLVSSRSGLALNSGVFVLNSPGIIDSGYRGEIGVILYNAGRKAFKVEKGDRIAQLVFVEYKTAVWERVESLGATERGKSGFGSSGKK